MSEELLLVTQADRDAVAACIRFLPMDALWAGAIQRGERDDHVLVQAFAKHRLSALIDHLEADGGVEDRVVVERVETVPIDHPFSVDETPPIWRVRIGEQCADFDYELAARNFAEAISALPVLGVGR